ncbi:hypothetical protein T492DRAFT_849989 [Pavlovales sp. CCMP2436]|nr:hypothetical protein T492DRAFT_849989 [Pavlovales sp. CCMP2436]
MITYGARVAAALAALAVLASPAAGSSATIRVNSVGFVPGAPKLATLAISSCGGNWSVVDLKTGDKALEGATLPTRSIDRSTLCLADFSALEKPGKYKLVVSGVGHSPPLLVGVSALNKPFKMAMAGFYMARCGQATPALPDSEDLVTTSSNGRPFEHEMCHAEDGLVDLKHTHESHEHRIEATGG